MILSEKLIKLLYYRIAQEEYSSRLYKSMGICMGYKGYKGAEALFAQYSIEEQVHAEWTYKFLADMDLRAPVQAIPATPKEFKDLPAVFLLAYKHEVEILKQCEQLAKVSLEDNAFTVHVLALKYVKEQVEEIGKITNLLDQLEAFGTSKEALKLLDNYLKELAND